MCNTMYAAGDRNAVDGIGSTAQVYRVYLGNKFVYVLPFCSRFLPQAAAKL